MEAVANVFSRSIQHTIEEKGILSSDMGPEKYASVYNMDQTAVYIDMNGRTTIEFVGAPTVDVLQGSEVITGQEYPLSLHTRLLGSVEETQSIESKSSE
ncbi:hypothetical protein L917_11083 [Phytophthora nicotianae]|uniref:Uncharacterized protein n=1 Tax=Phytophthora nicotianae TaxID=4792 RepID=W2L0J0_PHYNI|nr:hypothetical protein L916_11176 [Phytophthora nicotianae]ETL90105.1 hypothetical protein L917_11083 [Phytophthora nicotianae]